MKKKQIFYRFFKRFYTFIHIHLIRGSLCVSCRNTTIFLNNNNNKATLNPLSYTNSLWAQNLKKKPQGLREQQVSGRSVQRFSKGAHHLSPDRLLLRSSREWDGLCQRTRFHQVWLPFSSLSFHFSSHCALKFHALLFCSRCRLLWAAPPSAGHSSLYVSQDFPVWGHAIWLLVCTVCIGDMCCGCFLRSSFICMYSPNNRIKKKNEAHFLISYKVESCKRLNICAYL